MGYSLREVADVTGLSTTTLHGLEHGRRRLTPDAKIQLARRLHTRVAELFDLEP